MKEREKKFLQTLRESGLAMTSEEQRAFAKRMLDKLNVKKIPGRAEVRELLANLKVPLSEEIIAMRGER